MSKNYITLLIFICLACGPVESRAQSFVWAEAGLGSSTDYAVRTNDGNFYTALGQNIAKYDSVASNSWQQSLTGFIIRGIVTDSVENLYVGGIFTGSQTIGSFTVTANTGYHCIFLAKFNSSGVILWLKQSYDNYYTYVDDVSIDNMGNPIVVGRFMDSLQIDSFVFDAPETNRVFLAKFSSLSGNCIWAKHLEAGSFGGGAIGPKLKVDSFGNGYIAGQYLGWAQFDSIYLTAYGGIQDAFILKFDGNGSILWVKTMGGYADEEVYSLDVDKVGNSYFSGYYGGTSATFDSFVLSGSPMDNYFTVKYDSTGTCKWAKLESSSRIAAYDSGYFCNTGFLSKYDSAGTLIWNKNVSGANNKVILPVENDVYVAGSFSGTVAFDTITLSAASSTLFIGKIGLPGIVTNVPELYSEAFEVYPNPTTNVINYVVEGKADSKIIIFSITGQVLYEQDLNNSASAFEGQIDLGSFSKGLYYLCVINSNGKLMSPIVLH